MKSIGKIMIAAAMGASVLAMSGAAASAAIVCSEGDCWHTHGAAYDYPPHAHIIVHPDNWRWAEGDRYHWHEHEGRGFWHGGRWEDF